MFFVISGYLITAILLKERNRTSTICLRRFYLRRAYRIFPAALFFMLTIFVVYWRTLHWYEITIALLYVVNYFPRPWVIGHLWSLSVEEQFYFLWPSVLKKWDQHLVPILIGVVAFSPIYTAALYHFKWIERLGSGTLPGVADNLAVGCLAAVFIARWPRISRPVFAALVAAVILIPLYVADTPGRTLFLLFVLNPLHSAAVGGILIHVVQNPYRILNIAPVVWLGQISYSLYLWQQVFLVWDDARAPRLGALQSPPWAIIMALGCATASYYWLEKPMINYGRGVVRRLGASAPSLQRTVGVLYNEGADAKRGESSRH